jgi:hypothetical protein
MIDVLTNPITLLCLGVVFILITSLYFYFRRSLSVLERAQMEQARILESFITNMEMSKMAQQHHNIGGGPVNMEINQEQNNTNLTNNFAVEGVRNQNLIDVSDENVSDSDSDSDSDSESDNDNDDSSDESGDDVSININMNVSNEMNNDVANNVANNDSFIGNNNIKVIQLNESEDLDNLNLSTFDIKSLDDSSTDSDDEDDEDGEGDTNDSHYNESEHDEIIKLPTTIQPVSEPSIVDASVNLPTPDLKSLNVQALRQMAENKLLITKGEKKTKKELLLLLK